MELPKFVKVQQLFPAKSIEDVQGELTRTLRAFGLGRRIRPGMRVAITAGSRGISDMVKVLSTLVAELAALGAEPFIVPAMGSHGGATAQGQLEVLAGYGITEHTMGVPILSSMETVELGQTPSSIPVHMDKFAYGADATVVVNRIKAHTAFRGRIESGLCKMIAVGLGKQEGAETLHSHGLGESIPEAAKLALEKANIALGVGLVENAFHRTCKLAVVAPEDMHPTDEGLLKLANEHFPRVPFQELDVLIVDWMGKNISGGGMDYNVIGMWRRLGGERVPNYERVVVLNLTPESHGNALGVGAADMIPRTLYRQIDFAATYANVLTANALPVGKIPVVLKNDREVIQEALRTSFPRGGPRMVRIRSTLDLDKLYVSEGLLPEVESNPRLKAMGELESLGFDARGKLESVWEH